MAKKQNKSETLKNAVNLGAFLLVAWGFYRFLFQFPEEVEELFIKPAVWLGATIYFVKKEKASLSSLGITSKNLFPAIYLSLALGALFVIEGLVVNFVKYQSFNFAANIGQKPLFAALGLSFATAISEEITFRGYIFNRVWQALGSEVWANLSTSLLWALIHVPVTIFVWKLSLGAALIYLLLTTIFGIGSAFVFARTKNVASSIFLHVLWEWPIILFR